jgi:ADP-heptose:LPS heptosyltransferase
VRAGALGDVLLLRRTVAALRRGGYEVTLLAPAVSAVALAGPGPSEVARVLDWERTDVAALLGGGDVGPPLQRELGAHAVAFAFTQTEEIVAGLRRHVDRVFARGPHPPAGVSAARWCAELVRELGLDPDASPPPCRATAEERGQAQEWLTRLPPRFLALHPGSGSPRKNWPAEHFVALARRVRPGQRWLVALGPADVALAGPFRREAACMIAEGLPLRALGALLADAGLFVGNDSGVSHLAAAWGAPTVALFGPTDARVWAPDAECARTVQSRTGEMAGIGVEEVAEAVRGLA